MEYRIIENFPNYEVNNIGIVKNKLTGRVLKQRTNKGGYLMLKLRNNQGFK